METRVTQFLTALRSTQGFLDDKGPSLGTINQSGARKSLDAATSELAALSETQGMHALRGRGARAKELRLARALRRKNLLPIVRVARAKLPEVEELGHVVLPPGSGNTQELVNFTRSLLKAAEPFTPTFVEAGLAADFADQTRAAAAEIEQVIGGKGVHRTSREEATGGITKVVREARAAVGMLDAFIKAQLAEGDPMLIKWESARRVIQGGGATATTQAAAPTAGPTPSTTPAPTGAPTSSSGTPASEAPGQHAA
jgi:hypothetical protein